MIFDNGTGDHLGEENNVKHQIIEILLHAAILAVHIHKIGHRLKGVERNTDRHYHMDKLQIAPEEGIDVFKNEVGILEVNKYSKVCKDGKTQYELCTAPAAVDQHCSAIVDGDG